VVAQDRPDYLDSRLKTLPFASGSIVAVSPVVKHNKMSLRLSVLPMRIKVYQVWYVVGGGGYNTLRIDNIKLLRLSLRNELACWRKKRPNTQISDRGDILNFAALPCEVKQSVIEFLPISDTLHLMQTCKSIKSEVALSSVSTPLVDKDVANTPSCFAVYMPTRNAQLHSVTMQCNIINREYWINSTAQACIVSHARPQRLDSACFAKRIQNLSFQEGRIVAKSSMAKTIKTSLTMTFLPRSDEVYQLWLCEDSAGCASFLQLNSVTMHTLGFGDVAAAFEAVYTGFSMEGRQGVARFASQNARGIGQLMHRSSDQFAMLQQSNIYYGTWNDKTIARLDDNFQLFMTGGNLADLNWTWTDDNAAIHQEKGLFLICDGGYHLWKMLICPFKDQPDGTSETKWSGLIESLRKDV
jgi:hypothetical protein